MIFSFFSVGLLVLLVSVMRDSIRTTLLTGTFLLAGTLIFGFGPVPEVMLTYLQNRARFNPDASAYNWSSQNVIIVLGGGSSVWPEGDFSSAPQARSRTMEALRLYRVCKSVNRECKILTAGGDPALNRRSEALIMADELNAAGVDPQDLMLEERSRNTFENAQFAAETLKDRRDAKLILVTSGYHLRRAVNCFEKAGLTVTPAPSDTIHASFKLWPEAINLYYSNLAFHEFAGMAEVSLLK